MKHAPALSALCVLLVACSALPTPPAPKQNTLVLEARFATTAPSSQRQPLVLAVSEVQARAGYDTRAMVYTTRSNELKYFADNRWADTPARMLLPLLEQALEQGGSFQAVTGPHSTLGARLRLDSELVELRQDFSSTPSRVQLALRVQLIDVTTQQVLVTRELRETEAASSDDPYAGALAADRALTRLLGTLVELCDAQSRRR